MKSGFLAELYNHGEINLEAVAESPSASIERIKTVATKLVDEIEVAIVGKRDRIEMAVLTLLCDGHLLLEDIPGVGKTTLAKALAQSIGGQFKRVQFTPDLLPSDITGSSVFVQSSSQFEFRPGPVFGNVVLADEINRATPKTQSALLEAMEEHQVTADGVSRPLPNPFFVIATQNSVEMTGTYPLPEAQLDRFFSRITLGYPSRSAEASILETHRTEQPIESVHEVVDTSELQSLQQMVRKVFVHESVTGYIVDVVRATRDNPMLMSGSSPRGSLHLMRASQAHAAMNGSSFVRPDDVKVVAPFVLGHRVIARGEARLKTASGGVEAVSNLISEIVDSIPAPVAAD